MTNHQGCMPAQAVQTPYGVMVMPAIHTPECLMQAWALNGKATGYEMA